MKVIQVPYLPKILLSTFLLCIAIYASQAETWHVSINGKDTNDGSEKKPFRTISKAAEMAWPGDTVLVMQVFSRP